MAEGGTTVKQIIGELRKDLLCAICEELFTLPITLHCRHTYCRKCLTGVLLNNPSALQKKELPCAFGCDGTKVPNPGLPPSKWAEQIGVTITIQSMVARVKSVKLEELRPGKNLPPKCQHHVQDFKYFCQECSEILCLRCLVGHINKKRCNSVVDIEDKRAEVKSTLNTNLREKSRQLQQYGVTRVTMEACESDIGDSCSKIESDVEEQFNIICALVNELKLHLLKRVRDLHNIELTNLKGRMEIVDALIADVRGGMENINECLTSNDVGQMIAVNGSCGGDVAVDEYARSDIRFIPTGQDELRAVLGSINFGRVISSSECNHDDAVVAVHADSDTRTPDLYDVTVVDVDDKETLVVADWNNRWLKSFRQHCQPSASSNNGGGQWRLEQTLPVYGRPYSICKEGSDHLLVTLPLSREIIRVGLLPLLHEVNRFTNTAEYWCLCVLSTSTLVAGRCWVGGNIIDIIDMDGRVLRSLPPLSAVPRYMHLNNDGNILVTVSDESVTCITPDGRVVWRYRGPMNYPQGIVSTSTGNVLVVDCDSNKIIRLSGRSGDFLGEVDTTQNNLVEPRGISVHGNCAFICESGNVKHYIT